MYWSRYSGGHISFRKEAPLSFALLEVVEGGRGRMPFRVGGATCNSILLLRYRGSADNTRWRDSNTSGDTFEELAM
eukprot:scaffold266166_cov63-Attheya_sp.AAC.6